jgi:hypothetical protein
MSMAYSVFNDSNDVMALLLVLSGNPAIAERARYEEFFPFASQIRVLYKCYVFL